jgi:hypothetical protein
MAMITLAVQSDGAEESTLVPVTPRVILQWEKSYANRSGTQLSNDAVRFEYLYEVAWIALGKPGDDYAKFCDTTDVAFYKEQGGAGTPQESEPDPTPAEASTES